MNKTANRRRAEAEAHPERSHDDDQALVFMGVGIPGSGKSTFLEAFARAEQIEYLSSDKLREVFTGDESDHTMDAKVWERYGEIVEETLAEGRSIVLDSTNVEKERRMNDIRRYREMGARGIIAVVFEVPLAVALERNETRARAGGRDVPFHAIRRMHGRLLREPVTADEGFDDIIRPNVQQRAG